ncbi:MAG: hypothetical protein Q4C54_03920 [Clostridia bacterium]|nr:hypothetical protein [Clostridia bacterium]
MSKTPQAEKLLLGEGLFLRDFPWRDAPDLDTLKEMIADCLLADAPILAATAGAGTLRQEDHHAVMQGYISEITAGRVMAAMPGPRKPFMRPRRPLAKPETGGRLCWAGNTDRGYALAELVCPDPEGFTFFPQEGKLLPFQLRGSCTILLFEQAEKKGGAPWKACAALP